MGSPQVCCLDGPGPRGDRVSDVNMDVDIHTLISHVNEHVLASVDAADLGGTLHPRGGNRHRLQLTLANALIIAVHVCLGNWAGDFEDIQVESDPAHVSQGTDLIGAGGAGGPAGELVLDEVGVVLRGGGATGEGEGAADPKTRRTGP